ncbi:MAG: ATP synthase F1 subunit delta [Planctomycetota bacterium]
MIAPVVVRRYAEALLDAAQDARLVAEVEADLALVAEAIESAEVRAFITNPTAESSVLRQRFLNVLDPHFKTQLVKNVLALLIDRRRTAVIPSLYNVYHQLALDSRGEAEGTIESAVPLGAEELRNAEQSLTKSMGKKVKLAPVVNRDLLGGVRITVGSKRFDASLKSRIASLRDRLLSAPVG